MDFELICISCGHKIIFKNIMTFQIEKGLQAGKTCPCCGAILVYTEDYFQGYFDEELIQEHENLHNLFEKIEEDGTKDLSKPYFDLKYFQEQLRKSEDRCHRKGLKQTPTLSFHDLECNEMALMDMVDIAFQEEIDAPEIFGDNCITQMNERFLHTFIDDCF